MLSPKHRYDQTNVGLSAAYPVRINAQVYEADLLVPPHDHEFYEIAIIVDGEMEHITDNGRERLGRGRILVLSPSSVHGYMGYEGLHLCNILYISEWFLSNIRVLRCVDNLIPLFFERSLYEKASTPGIVSLDAVPAEMKRLQVELDSLMRADHESLSLLYRESSFFKLIDELLRIYRRQGGADLTRPIRKEVQRGLEIIETVVAERGAFSARQVARHAGLSLTHFDTLFREFVGMSPSGYYQKHRVQQVCRRLLGTEHSISEIAHEFMFADAAHLNRHFRRYQNMTPGGYRRRFGLKE